MYNVSQVLSSEFARTWHEAVAIVQEAAHQLQPGLALPGPEDIIIDEAGALTFGFGSESSASPVSALAGLLDSLLKGVEAPQALRDLASQNMGRNPAHTGIASFSQALAFFERPNRANDIGAVARRLGGSREQAAVDQEFQRLREKVAHTSEPEKKEDKKPAKKQPKLTKVQQLAVVSTICLLVFGTLAYRSGLHRNAGTLTAGVESGIQGIISAGLEWAGVSKTASAAPSDEPVEAEDDASRANGNGKAERARPTRRPEPKRASSDAQRAPASSSSVSTQPAAGASDATLKSAPLVGVPPVPQVRAPNASAPASAPKPTVTVVPASGAIFSAANPEVQPPVLVRPQLPTQPAPGDDTGIFEMLVDENGDVSEIELTSPRRRFHDRILVAAAKAWKFKPAMLNGYPVKYRVRIFIILKGMP